MSPARCLSVTQRDELGDLPQYTRGVRVLSSASIRAAHPRLCPEAARERQVMFW